MNRRVPRGGWWQLVLMVALTTCGSARGNSVPAEIVPYVSYVREHGQDPVDYILRLFSSHDVVVLAERDHRETTQYDFIFKLISDPRFYTRVGTIFTECGSVSRQADLDAYLDSAHPDPSARLNLLRNLNFFALGWPRNNLFDFLRKFHDLDQSLDTRHRMRWFFSDVPWRWQGMTPAEYQTDMGYITWCRDEMMAMYVARKMAAMERSDAPRRKALVIMNSRHGFKVPQEKDGHIYAEDFAHYLNRMQPTAGRVASVMFNTASSGGHPIHGGKWDAAFAFLGNVPRAVSFHGDSPFGRDPFDYGQLPPTFKYQDVFDGMIFFQPLQNQRLQDDIPGYFDEPARSVMMERARMTGELSDAEADLADRKAHPEKYALRPACAPQAITAVARWLKPQK